jgi:hypothetical protein
VIEATGFVANARALFVGQILERRDVCLRSRVDHGRGGEVASRMQNIALALFSRSRTRARRWCADLEAETLMIEKSVFPAADVRRCLPLGSGQNTTRRLGSGRGSSSQTSSVLLT